MSSTMTTGQKIAKVFFYLAFAPYAIALGFFVYGCITEDFETGAFAAIILLYLMCIYAIIPVCLIYQIGYVLRKKCGKLKALPLKKFAAVFVIIAVTIGGVILADAFKYEIEYAIMKAGARSMLRRADEVVYYFFEEPPDTDAYPGTSTAFDIKDGYSSVLVDYDRKQVGILYDDGLLDCFWKVTLEADNSMRNNIKKKYVVQTVIPLNSPGEKLITFCESEENNHRTIAIILECESGTYCSDEIRETDMGYTQFSGLKWSRFYVGDNLTADDFDEEWNLITANEEN